MQPLEMLGTTLCNLLVHIVAGRAADVPHARLASVLVEYDLDRIDDESERQKIRESLLDYCKLDTLAMVMIWRELSNVAETG